MPRKESLWVHEPPCCFRLQTYSEPRLRMPARKSRPPCALYHLPPRLPKRKEILAASKHGHPYAQTSPRYIRTEYERSGSILRQKNNPQKFNNYDETSTDTRSVSDHSYCTSHLTVDTSAEMAAVNREVDALLFRYENTLSMRYRREGGRTELDGGKSRPRLSPEQERLLALERPPLDRLQDLPLEYLQPRKPEHLRPSGPPKTKIDKKHVLQSPPTKNSARSESAERMSRMRKEMEAQGLIPKGGELGVNVKPIYANVELDESTDIKIDFNGLSTSLSRSIVDRTSQENPISIGPLKSGNSVSTQTDNEQLLSSDSKRCQEDSDMGRSGIHDKTEKSKNENQSGMRTSVLKTDISLFDQRPSDKIVVPPEQRELRVYNTQTIFNTLNKVKQYSSLIQNKEWKKSEALDTKTGTKDAEIKYEDDLNQMISLPPINSNNKLTDLTTEKKIENSMNYRNDYSFRNYPFFEKSNKTPPSIDNKVSNSSDFKCSSESKISLLRNSTAKFLEEHNDHQNIFSDSFNNTSNLSGKMEGGGDADLILPAGPVENVKYVSPISKVIKEIPYKPTSLAYKEFELRQEKVGEQNAGNEGLGFEKKIDSCSSNKSAFKSEAIENNSENEKLRSENSTSKKDVVTPKNIYYNSNGEKCNLSKDNNTSNSEITPSEKNQTSETTKKENSLRLEGTSCNNIWSKKETEDMHQSEAGEITEQSLNERGVAGLLKQLRADLLKHIEAEAKQIEVLNKCLEGVGVELDSSTARTSCHENKSK